MESSVETTKPTDKPHSKLDVLSGKTRAGTQSPTKVFIRGKRKLKGPLARLNQRQRRTRSEWQTWQGIEVVCRRQIHIGGKRVGQKQIPSSATNRFISARNVPVRQLLSAGKVSVRCCTWKIALHSSAGKFQSAGYM